MQLLILITVKAPVHILVKEDVDRFAHLLAVWITARGIVAEVVKTLAIKCARIHVRHNVQEGVPSLVLVIVQVHVQEIVLSHAKGTQIKFPKIL